MSNLWVSMLPLIIGGALVPIQIVITILLLSSASGKRTALAWIAGMTAVRLVQGVVFGSILSVGTATTDESSGTSSMIVATILLVVAVLLIVSGIRQLLTDVDPDAPPPKWLTATEVMGPAKGFALGAGLLVIGVKSWVFTLGAIALIGQADLGRGSSVLTFLAFVVLTEIVHLVALAMVLVAPDRSEVALAAASGWLSRHNRVIVIVVSFVFGLWFLVKALNGLGVI